jgi:hypothetical protein
MKGFGTIGVCRQRLLAGNLGIKPPAGLRMAKACFVK